MNVKFVAEMSSNHQGDLNRCLDFIDRAAWMGCDAVKFQYFRIEELFVPEVLEKSREHRRRKKWELPQSFLPAIAEHCSKKDIEFGCTPFFLEGVKHLMPHVDFFKIASYELLWDGLLTACAETGKPVVLSTGMASLKEVTHAVDVIMGAGCRKLTLLHCVSKYPAPVEQCNLAAIETMRKSCLKRGFKGEVDVGWSDHSVKPGVIYRAVYRWDSCMIEFHMDLEGRGDEFAGGHCWLPDEMKLVIQTVRNGFEADGVGEKGAVPCEQPERDWRADPLDGLRPLRKIRTAMSHGISIKDRFVIVPKNVGIYHSFPTLIRFENSLILGFRSGVVHQDEMHGTDGTVHFLQAEASQPRKWRPLSMEMDAADDEHNEMDAILSFPNEGEGGKDVFIVTRNYNTHGICRTWLSKLEEGVLKKGFSESHLNLIPRRHLKEISDVEINCYGHIQRTLSHELLMPGYISSPVLLCSKDNGLSWQLRSRIYENDSQMTLSEFSMVHKNGTEWMALIRNEKTPQTLQLIVSDDDGRTWSLPEPTGLTGHAPMVIRTQQGDFMVLYRDLSEKKQGVSIGLSRDQGRCWEPIGSLCKYTGSLYDGGYGDLLELKQNLFLAVYYLCDEDASPWIEGVLFSL